MAEPQYTRSLSYADLLSLCAVSVPEGESGGVKIQRFTITPEDEKMERLRSMFSRRGRYCPAGAYTRLLCGGALWMSDTPDERRDHMEFLRQARGKVLIHGLGLGMCLTPTLSKPEVVSVTVVEVNPDVIALVAPHYRALWGDRINIIEGDALTYSIPKGERWDTVWHDIWESISEDNLETMGRLHRRFGRRCSWQGSWCRERIVFERDRSRRSGWRG